MLSNLVREMATVAVILLQKICVNSTFVKNLKRHDVKLNIIQSSLPRLPFHSGGFHCFKNKNRNLT